MDWYWIYFHDRGGFNYLRRLIRLSENSLVSPISVPNLTCCTCKRVLTSLKVKRSVLISVSHKLGRMARDLHEIMPLVSVCDLIRSSSSGNLQSSIRKKTYELACMKDNQIRSENVYRNKYSKRPYNNVFIIFLSNDLENLTSLIFN